MESNLERLRKDMDKGRLFPLKEGGVKEGHAQEEDSDDMSEDMDEGGCGFCRELMERSVRNIELVRTSVSLIFRTSLPSSISEEAKLMEADLFKKFLTAQTNS